MYVYFIQVVDKDILKIGKSLKPNKRFKSLNTSTPFTLELEWLIEYDEKEENLERDLHKLFDKYRSKGEWFNISMEDVFEILDNNGYSNRLIKYDSIEYIDEDNQGTIQCIVCNKYFMYPSLLARHHSKNKTCKDVTVKITNYINTINDFTENLRKREEKYNKLKMYTKLLLEQNKTFTQQIEQLVDEKDKLFQIIPTAKS